MGRLFPQRRRVGSYRIKIKKSVRRPQLQHTVAAPVDAAHVAFQLDMLPPLGPPQTTMPSLPETKRQGQQATDAAKAKAAAAVETKHGDKDNADYICITPTELQQWQQRVIHHVEEYYASKLTDAILAALASN